MRPDLEFRVLELAPSGYYDWLLQPISNRAQEDDAVSTKSLGTPSGTKFNVASKPMTGAAIASPKATET
jgi:hypothetical protein